MYRFIHIFDTRIRICTNNKRLLDDFCFVMSRYISNEVRFDWDSDIDQNIFFNQPRFREKYIVITGSAFLYNGKTVLLIAPPYSGKSSFVCQVIESGAQLISDDLIIIDKKDLKVLPLEKPMCFRTKAIEKYGINENILKKNGIRYRLYRDNHGVRFLISVFDILSGCYAKNGSKIDLIFFKGNANKNMIETFLSSIKNVSAEDLKYALRICRDTHIFCVQDFNDVLTFL